jgi:hypothetical protein
MLWRQFHTWNQGDVIHLEMNETQFATKALTMLRRGISWLWATLG